MTERTDREMLELAALAAGINAVREFTFEDGSLSGESPFGLWNRDRGGLWNPLEDDGDALRLAVKLCMSVVFGANYVIVNGDVQMPTVNNANDPYAASRSAITRAAAEIGANMKDEK